MVRLSVLLYQGNESEISSNRDHCHVFYARVHIFSECPHKRDLNALQKKISKKSVEPSVPNGNEADQNIQSDEENFPL